MDKTSKVNAFLTHHLPDVAEDEGLGLKQPGNPGNVTDASSYPENHHLTFHQKV